MLIASVFAITLALPSCSNDSGDTTTSITFENYQTGRSYTLEGSARDFMQTEDITFYDSVSMVVPTRLGAIDITTLRDSITSIAFGATNVKAIVPAINRWLSETASDQGFKATPVDADPASALGYSYLSGYVVYLSPDMLVYCVRNELYNPGAAHGMSTKRYINYYIGGKNTARVLTLSDIFTPTGLKKLPDVIAAQTADMSDIIGPTEVSGLPSFDNFFISSEGQIVFAYQPYEISDYAHGFINVPFEPYELVDYMTPLGVSIFNLGDFNVSDEDTGSASQTTPVPVPTNATPPDSVMQD